MSERSPRKKTGTKRLKSSKCSKKLKKIKLNIPPDKEAIGVKEVQEVEESKTLPNPDGNNSDVDKSEAAEDVDESEAAEDVDEIEAAEDVDEIDWQKLEEELERNAAKANLTTINVKSILHVS